MPVNRVARWRSGSRRRIVEGAAASVVAALVLTFVFAVLPGLEGSDSASTEVSPAPVPTTSAECLLKMTGETTGLGAEALFERLSTATRAFSELWQANPGLAHSESLVFIDELRFQSRNIRKLSVIVAERDIEFATDMFDTAMAATDAADMLYFDSVDHADIVSALAVVSAAAADLARKIDYGC